MGSLGRLSGTSWWVVAAAVLGTVTAGFLISRDMAQVAMAAVGLVALGLIAMVEPRWLLVIGGVLVFAAGFFVAGIPLSDVGSGLIIVGIAAGIGRSRHWPPLLLATSVLLLAWLVFVAFDDADDFAVQKRFVSLVLWLALVLALAVAGNLLTWVARGLLAGLLLSVVASMVLEPSFGTRWGGLIGDANFYALQVAVAVPLIVDQLRLSRVASAAVWGLGGFLTFMADSRTGMLALATGLLVYLLLPKLKAWSLVVPFVTLSLASRLPDEFVRGGRWEDRLGSDELRERIDAASTRQIEENFVTGRTLGAGKVDLSVYGDPPQDLVFLLHNSYKSLITEIGVVGLGLYGLLAVGAVVQALRGTIARGALAALAAAAVMATQLGEVLVATPVALALGFAWASSLASQHEAVSRRLSPVPEREANSDASRPREHA